MHPHPVASLRALPGPQRAPQRARVAQAARPQLEADQRGERLLGGTTGRAAAPYGLLELGRRRHPLVGRLADHLVDPALDQRQGDLETLQGGFLAR
jgi:hypothetical protein